MDIYKRTIKKYRIQEVDIYNIDKTGFTIRVGKEQWVVTRNKRKRSQITTDRNRDRVILVKTIGGWGEALPPILILASAWFMEGQVVHNDLEGTVAIGMSDSGYMNDKLMLKQVAHFNLHSAKRQRGLWQLLIFNNLGSHITREFIEYYNAYNIIALSLPVHASHFMQPLDVVVFQLFKQYHHHTVDTATRIGYTDFNKREFLTTIITMHKNTFKIKTVKLAFKATGLIPFNPAVVLDKMRDFIPDRATPPPVAQEPAQYVFSTPKTVPQLSHVAHRIFRERKNVPKQLFWKFMNAGIIFAYRVEYAEAELAHVLVEVTARNK